MKIKKVIEILKYLDGLVKNDKEKMNIHKVKLFLDNDIVLSFPNDKKTSGD